MAGKGITVKKNWDNPIEHAMPDGVCVPAEVRIGPVLVAPATVLAPMAGVTDTVFRYSTPKTGDYTIAHMAMIPDGTDTADKGYLVTHGEGLTVDQSACFNSGVNLPQNSTITAVTVYYASGNTSDVFAQVRRNRLSDGAPQVIASLLFTNNTETRTAGNITVDATKAVVKNNTFLYAFGLCLGAGDVFYAARISYQYDNAGD